MNSKETMVIFDWDDTLLSVGQHMLSCQHKACLQALQPCDKYSFCKNWPVPSKDQLAQHIGHRFKDTIVPKIFVDFDANNPLHIQWVDSLYSYYKEHYRREERMLFKGVLTMLTQLYNAGFMLAIATNKSRDLLTEELDACGIHKRMFMNIVCGDDAQVSPHFKPHPCMINLIQHQDGVQHYVMVGDRDSDVIAAQSSVKAGQTCTIAVQTNQQHFYSAPSCMVTSAADITPELLLKLIASSN